MSIYLQNFSSIQQRMSPVKFAHWAEKSGKGSIITSISNLSTKAWAPPAAASSTRPRRYPAPSGVAGPPDRRRSPRVLSKDRPEKAVSTPSLEHRLVQFATGATQVLQPHGRADGRADAGANPGNLLPVLSCILCVKK